jgi:hypothetical protein
MRPPRWPRRDYLIRAAAIAATLAATALALHLAFGTGQLHWGWTVAAYLAMVASCGPVARAIFDGALAPSADLSGLIFALVVLFVLLPALAPVLLVLNLVQAYRAAPSPARRGGE